MFILKEFILSYYFKFILHEFFAHFLRALLESMNTTPRRRVFTRTYGGIRADVARTFGGRSSVVRTDTSAGDPADVPRTSRGLPAGTDCRTGL